ncbi:MAG: hypothetical protein GX638_04940 [Crenarchaeota archaeon]|jgi:hypothetical protein|nr:hypothetical protein [Thermoproteota archaeon]
MSDEEINEYRKILEKEFTKKDLEIDNQLTYISIGSMGFFITIQEKFLKVTDQHCKIIFILSLVFLFITFILIIIRNARTRYHDLSMMSYIDEMDNNNIEHDQTLYDIWEKCHKELGCFRVITYITLGIGIGLQLLYIIFNL